MYRVVVADDEGKTCKKVMEFLQNNGYQVVGEAADGLEAVSYTHLTLPTNSLV